MAERFPSDAELDAMIEAALAEDVLLPVPVDLHGKIAERVQLAALQQRAQARFRYAVLSGFAASVGIVTALATLVALTKFDVFVRHGISGGQGLLDSYAATFALSWPQYLEGITFALVLSLGAGTVWAGLIPLRWRESADTHHPSRSGDSAVQGPLQTP